MFVITYRTASDMHQRALALKGAEAAANAAPADFRLAAKVSEQRDALADAALRASAEGVILTAAEVATFHELMLLAARFPEVLAAFLDGDAEANTQVLRSLGCHYIGEDGESDEEE